LEYAARFTREDLETVYIVGPGGCNKKVIVEGLMPILKSCSVVVEKRDSGPVLQLMPLSSTLPLSAGSQAQTRAGFFVSMVNVTSGLAKEWSNQFIGRALPTLRICESSYYDLVIDPKSYGYSIYEWFA